MAIVNHNYEFIYVDVGKNGRMSDGGIFETTDFYHKLKGKMLKLPEKKETIKNLNFCFLADEGFALHDNILKPYAQKELDHDKSIFNYRLSRARNVENAFGIIASRFQILHRPIQMKHENICYTVLAICAVHNYLRRHSNTYMTTAIGCREDTVPGTNQQGEIQNSSTHICGLQPHRPINPTLEAKENRNNYKLYFNSTEGSLSWQENMLGHH